MRRTSDGCWRATLRRSSHRETGGHSEKGLAKTIGEATGFRGGCYDGRRRSADAELWRPC